MIACLAAGLLIIGSTGCDKKNAPVCDMDLGDECVEDSDCSTSLMTCAICQCICDPDKGAMCMTDGDCNVDEGERCDTTNCQCVNAVDVAPNTTDCTTDATGCLVGGESTCWAVFTVPLAGSASVHVEGELEEGYGIQAVTVTGFVSDPMPPYFHGYRSLIQRMDDQVSGQLEAVDGTGIGLTQWSSSTAIYPFEMDISMDSAATSTSCEYTGENAPSAPIASTDMQAAPGTSLVLEIWRARVCVFTFTTP